MKDPIIRDQVDKNFTELAPIIFQYDRNSDRSIAVELRNAFLDGPLLGNRSIGLEHVSCEILSKRYKHQFINLFLTIYIIYSFSQTV